MEFSQVIKKAKRSTTKSAVEIFRENCKVKSYLDLSTKVTYKYLLGYEYLDKQTQIDALEEIEESERKVETLDALLKEQEIDLLFNVLNLYCDGVDFNTEDKVGKKLEQYDFLFTSGIFDYIYGVCEKDYESLMKMIDRNINSGLNTASQNVLKVLAKELIGSIDLNALQGLKKEIEDIVQTPGYEELKKIGEKIQ